MFENTLQKGHEQVLITQTSANEGSWKYLFRQLLMFNSFSESLKNQMNQ